MICKQIQINNVTLNNKWNVIFNLGRIKSINCKYSGNSLFPILSI